MKKIAASAAPLFKNNSPEVATARTTERRKPGRPKEAKRPALEEKAVEKTALAAEFRPSFAAETVGTSAGPGSREQTSYSGPSDSSGRYTTPPSENPRPLSDTIAKERAPSTLGVRDIGTNESFCPFCAGTNPSSTPVCRQCGLTLPPPARPVLPESATPPATPSTKASATAPLAPPAIHLRGKVRSFWRGLALIVVTLGIYVWYWHFAARKEITDQFKMRAFPALVYWGALAFYLLGVFFLVAVPLLGIVAYVFCIIPSLILQVVYMSGFIDDVNGARRTLGLPVTFTFGSFILWYVLGALVIVGPFVAYSKLQAALNEVWSIAPGRLSTQTPGISQ
ncbi:MAG: hypothetical protein HY556_04910 [Euryarchaeota archaeon]|nr:hypothetical protein [Euryarchaeota archaeon]